ncbi:MAG: hypothetical protein OXG65_09470 [Chloroflexi bacterium]|nr:hypothetical protein [Chloroflexota bacterium]
MSNGGGVSDPPVFMELADIVAREGYEWTRSGCTVEPKFWDVVSPRFYARGFLSG